jgi:hypothetical protein
VLAKDGKDSKNETKDKDKDEQAANKPAPPRPLPDMFSNGVDTTSHMGVSADGKAVKQPEDEDDSDEKANTKKGFFAKMFSWW